MDGPIRAELEWTGAETFAAKAGEHEFALDGESSGGASPMQHLAVAIGGCMGIDIAHILAKMRTPSESLRIIVEGSRPEEPPRRFESLVLTVEANDTVPEANLERAIRLSRERYCSVWHSLAQDTELRIESRFSPPRPA